MKRMLIAAVLAASASLTLALPTVQQVEAEVQQGRYAQAETMMKEVVDAKPGSARAHYVYAEILAHNGRFADAAAQARLARSADPSLAFAGDAGKFRSFEQLLEREQGGAAVRSSGAAARQPGAMQAAPERSSGIPSWVWIGGVLVIGFMLWRGLSRSRAAAAGAGPFAAGNAAGGYPVANGPVGPGGGYGPAPYGQPPYGPGGYAPGGPYAGPGAPVRGGMGGGLLGAGLAGAGGFAAGMLADELLHRHGNTNDAAALGGGGGGGFVPGAGGADPFASTDAAAELETRNVDFGAGGNDWGGDGGSFADGGGGGGGGDDGGGWDS